MEKKSSDEIIDWTLFINSLCWRNVRNYWRLLKHVSSEIFLFLFDESSDYERLIDLSKIEDVIDLNNFPHLNAIFTKWLGIIRLIDIGIELYNSSDFEVRETSKSEKWLFIFWIWAICSWITRELKNIKLKSNEVYNKLDD